MFKDGIFKGVQLNAFHYFMGANCYQHALNFPTPVIIRKVAHKRTFIGYVNFTPNNVSTASHQDGAAYKRAIIDGCQSDGAIDLGNAISFKEGYRTTCLCFSSKGNDFHFDVLREDETIETKLRLHKPTRKSDYSNLISGYRADRCLLLPEGNPPPYITRLDLRPLRMRAGQSTFTKCLEVYGDRAELQYSRILCMTDKRILPDEEDGKEKVEIPGRFDTIFRPISRLPGRHLG